MPLILSTSIRLPSLKTRSTSTRKRIPFSKIASTKNMFTHAQALFLFHHVFLPPKTPQKDDFDPELGHVFFEAMQPALAAFATADVGVDPQILGTVADMVETMRTVHDRSTHDIVEGELQAAIHRVVENGTY